MDNRVSITAKVSEELKFDIKTIANDENLTISDIVNKLLTEYRDEYIIRDTPTEVLNKLYPSTVGENLTDWEASFLINMANNKKPISNKQKKIYQDLVKRYGVIEIKWILDENNWN